MDAIRGLLLDLDGTLYVGDELIPGAREALAWCAERRIPVRFVTNTTSKPRGEIAAKLARLGLPVPAEHLFTAPAAAREVLCRRQWTRCHCLLRAALRADLAGIEEVDADPQAVVVGDLGEEFTFARLNAAFRLLQNPDCAFLTLARNRCFRAAGGLTLDVGAFVAALEYATGREAELIGKPSPAFFESALASLALPAAAVVVIGDDLESDVLGAQRCGLRGALVRTGKFQEAALIASPQKPDFILDSIAGLPALF